MRKNGQEKKKNPQKWGEAIHVSWPGFIPLSPSLSVLPQPHGVMDDNKFTPHPRGAMSSPSVQWRAPLRHSWFASKIYFALEMQFAYHLGRRLAHPIIFRGLPHGGVHHSFWVWLNLVLQKAAPTKLTQPPEFFTGPARLVFFLGQWKVFCLVSLCTKCTQICKIGIDFRKKHRTCILDQGRQFYVRGGGKDRMEEVWNAVGF